MESKTVIFLVIGVIVGTLAGIGVGFALFHTNGNDVATDNDDAATGGNNVTEYSFYLNFGDDDKNTGWYFGSGENATSGFDNAMKKAGFEYEVSGRGSISTINEKGTNGWQVTQYIYRETTKDAADASILSPKEDNGIFYASNGWKIIKGYDMYGELELGEFNSNIFYASMRQTDYSATSPVSDNGWMATGPFA